MFGLGAAALLARRLLLNLGLDRLVLDATSPQVFPGPVDSTSSREVAGGHLSWDNLTRQEEGGGERKEDGRGESEEEEENGEILLVGELATTTSSTELPTGTRPCKANNCE